MDAATVQSEYEIERGKPIPSKNHAIVQGNVYFLLRQKYEDQFRVVPEVSVIVNEKERVPDIALFEKLEFSPGNDEVKLSEMPFLIIEILSPKQNLTDLIVKSHIYFEAGVQSYWLILPDLKTVYVFSAPDEYEAYVKTGMLKDTQLDIELDLENVFR